MKRKITVFLASLIICSFTCIKAQEKSPVKKIEVDMAIMPVSRTILNQAEVISADLAVRYKFSDSFSGGVCTSPTFIEYGYGETNYLPFFLSLRYSFNSNKTISPYLLLNLGGSFIQLEPDVEFQGRVSIGADFKISQQCSLFFEAGISYITTRNLWSPISIGIRF